MTYGHHGDRKLSCDWDLLFWNKINSVPRDVDVIGPFFLPPLPSFLPSFTR